MLEQPRFGQRLRELRIARGLSQAALAEPGLSTSYLSRLESGARPPTAKAVAYLADRLGVPSSEFGGAPSAAVAQMLARGLSARDEVDPTVTRELFADAVGVDRPVEPALQWQVLWILSESQVTSADRDSERQTLDTLVRLGDETGVPELRVRARVKLSRFHRVTGAPELASQVAADATAIARAGGVSTSDLVRALLGVVSAEAESGRLIAARQAADELVALVDRASDVAGSLVAEARWAVATVHVRQGLHDEATALLEAAMRDLDSHDNILLWTRLRLAAASLYLQMNPRRTEAAAARLGQIEAVIALVGSRQHQQEYRGVQAQLAFHEGRYDDAEKLVADLAGEPHLLSFRDQIRLEILHFRLQVRAGSVAEALEKLTALAGRLQDSANAELAAEAWRTLAESLATVTSAATAGETA